MEDFGAYLGRIDWGLAVLVAGIGIAVAAVVTGFLLATTSELAELLPYLQRRIARTALDARHEVPARAWVCDRCRSINDPVARRCYRGCGERADVEAEEIELVDWVPTNGGRERRRG